MKSLLTAVALTAALASTNALAITGFLNGQSTSGMHRYCYYSNGVILTISATSLCPLSIN